MRSLGQPRRASEKAVRNACRAIRESTRYALFITVAGLMLAIAEPSVAFVAKIVAPDATQGDQFGQAIALDGGLLVVGAPGDDDRGSQTGAVYVFRFDGLHFQFEQKLIGADTAAGDEFGFAVDVDFGGRRVVVGAPGGEAAYVFRFSGTSWNEEQKLTRGGNTAEYGFSVSTTTGWIAVGQPNTFNAGKFGSAQLWRFDGDAWLQDGNIDTSFSEPLAHARALGDSVAIGATDSCGGNDPGDPCVVVGDPLYSTSNNDPESDRYGARFHAERYRVDNEGNQWEGFRDGYLGSERGSREGDAVDLAYSAGLVGAMQVIGSPGRTLTPEAVVVECASASSVCRSNPPFGPWTLTASSSVADADFGVSLSTDGASIAVGAPKDAGGGSAFLYELNGAATAWPEVAKVQATDIHGGTRFGEAVAVDGIHFAVGAPDADALPTFGSGAVYVGDAFIQCLNGVDDDGDGLADALDPDCEQGWDDVEQSFSTPTEGDLFALRASGAPKVVKIDPVTGAQTLLHSGAPFGFLTGIEIDDAGDLWLLDRNTTTLYRMDLSGGTGLITPISTGGLISQASGLGRLSDGNFLVSDALTADVIRVTPTGAQSIFRTITANAGQGRDVEVRPSDGAVFTLDEVTFPFSDNAWILREYDAAGAYVTYHQFLTNTSWAPQRVGVHKDGAVLVSDLLAPGVDSFPAGGTPVSGTSDPQIFTPVGLAGEPSGTYLVGNSAVIYRIDPSLPENANATLLALGDHLGNTTDIAVFHRDCQDGVDNDGDGTIDFGGDPGCDSLLDRSEVGPANLLCDNGLDDDGDGLVDAGADPGCASPFSAIEDPQCDDGIDNDGDGGIDTDGDPRDWDCLDVPSHDDESTPAPEPVAAMQLWMGCLLLARLGSRRARSTDAGTSVGGPSGEGDSISS